MAVTESNYTGNGSTTLFTFTFPYISTSDVKVSLDGVASTAFTLSNATTVSMNSAPGSGVALRIFRSTDSSTQQATFFPGSAIKSNDLNNNFKQVLYVSQETENEATDATTTANTAKTTADSASTASSTAVSTANTASTNASAAVTTANTASTNATAAVSTANTASTNASTAVSTANTASTNASTALSTANTADTNATTALNNSRESDGSGGFISAVTKANTAITTANSASSTATTANTNASAAVTTANSAASTATAAQNAVAGAAFYTPVANVAGIPGSPSDNDRVEVADSTNIQSFSPLTGYPAGFTGASGLTARIQYSSSGSTWNWVDYFANDPEDRYYIKTSGTTNATNIATNATNIATKMPLAGGTFTGAVSFDDNVIVKGDSTNGSGKLTLNCENNSHGVHIKGPPHSAGATYTLTLPNNTGSNGQFLSTDGSGSLSWGTADVSSRLALAGGTMTGFVTLHADPTANLHASTKQYVDANKVIAIDAGNFDNGSSTISSTLTIDGGSF